MSSEKLVDELLRAHTTFIFSEYRKRYLIQAHDELERLRAELIARLDKCKEVE